MQRLICFFAFLAVLCTALPAFAIESDSGKYQYEEQMPPADELIGPPKPPEVLHAHKPYIAIVIDDMGVDHKRSARAIEKLPATVTLSFLPYSPGITQQTKDAYDAGHELLVHMPMEAENDAIDPGPDFLSTKLSNAEVKERTVKNLDAFKGYIGVNNHMGSKFTQDHDRLAVVMKELEKRHLVFLDSKTVAESIAEDVARENHLPTTHRDVFIDHFEDAALVAQYLKRIEYVAKHLGSAVAIGHPKDVTLNALEKWIPTLKDKGFQLVSLSTVIDLRAAEPAAAAAEPKKVKVAEAKKSKAKAADLETVEVAEVPAVPPKPVEDDKKAEPAKPDDAKPAKKWHMKPFAYNQ